MHQSEKWRSKAHLMGYTKLKNVKLHFLCRKQPKSHSFMLLFSPYKTQMTNFAVYRGMEILKTR